MQQMTKTSLHDRVAARLRAHIRATLTPGDRLGSERALSAALGVAVHTVREALSVLAHEGLVERRHGSGTFVAEVTVHQHVAIVAGFDSAYPVLGYSACRRIEQVQLALSKRGMAAHIYLARFGDSDTIDPTHDSLRQQMQAGRVSGIVVVRGPFDLRWACLLDESRVPVVGRKAYLVDLDMAGMVQDGVRYLRSHGCWRIALLAWRGAPVFPVPESVLRRTRDAFHNALARQGLAATDDWVRDDLAPMLPGAGYEEFREIWSARDEKPDGLLITDDVLFADVALAILELGIQVPEQLVVVTFANAGSGIRYPFPTARMEYDVAAAARLQADMLVRLMQGHAVEKYVEHLPLRWVGLDAGHHTGESEGQAMVVRCDARA